MPFTERVENEGWGKIMKFCFRHSPRCLCGNQVETAGSSSLLCSGRGLGHRDIKQRAISTKMTFRSVRMEAISYRDYGE